MKMSIIIGVLHMILGILLKGLNTLHFKEYAGFLFDFLPQLIFMTCTFGYMVFCIIYKWFLDFSESPGKSPSIISLFINFIQETDTPLYNA